MLEEFHANSLRAGHQELYLRFPDRKWRRIAVTASSAAVSLCLLSATLADDSTAQFKKIRFSLVSRDGDVLALVEQKIDPLGARGDLRSQLSRLSRIVTNAQQHS